MSLRLVGLVAGGLLAIACGTTPVDEEQQASEVNAASAGAACCKLVEKHLSASSGLPGASEDCLAEEEALCSSSASAEDRARCASARRHIHVRDRVSAALDRSGCTFPASVATNIERCEQYGFMNTLEGLAPELVAACTADVHAPMPAEYKDLYEGPQMCAEPALNGPWDLMVQTPNETGIPPNCHGTAAKIHGIDLERVASDRSTWKPSPGTSLPSDCTEMPAAGDLQVDGFLVNMDHEHKGAASANDCGAPYFIPTTCKGGKPRATLFLLNMTRACWDRVLDEAGYPKTPKTEPVRPGCMLTSNDHTITVVERDGAMCQIYEKTSPYSNAWYRWVPCCRLAHAEEMYCPRASATTP